MDVPKSRRLQGPVTRLLADNLSISQCLPSSRTSVQSDISKSRLSTYMEEMFPLIPDWSCSYVCSLNAEGRGREVCLQNFSPRSRAHPIIMKVSGLLQTISYVRELLHLPSGIITVVSTTQYDVIPCGPPYTRRKYHMLPCWWVPQTPQYLVAHGQRMIHTRSHLQNARSQAWHQNNHVRAWWGPSSRCVHVRDIPRNWPCGDTQLSMNMTT